MNGSVKVFKSPKYNYIFNGKNGFFARWGKTKEDDPEYSPFGPEIMDIELSTICSRGCSFCYKSNTKYGTYMSFKTFKKLFSKFDSRFLTQIAFGIGDLNSNPDLYKIMSYCRAQEVIPNITINGDQLTPKHIAHLVQLTGAVAVSYYNKDTCFDAVQQLTNAGLKQVNIHCLLAAETYDSCLELLQLAKSDIRLQKLKSIVFLWLKPKGDRNQFHQLQDAAKYRELIDMAFKLGVSIGFDSCTAPIFLEAIKDLPNYKELEQMVEGCESTSFSYYINVAGVGYPCSFSEGLQAFKGIDILKAKDFLKDVWNHPETVGFRKKLITNKDCRNCRSCQIYNLGGNK